MSENEEENKEKKEKKKMKDGMVNDDIAKK